MSSPPHRPAATPGGGRRQEVLTTLRAAATPLGAAEIAARIGVHPNTVRFHLGALVAAGQVERVASTPDGPGRPPLAFRPRRAMDPGGRRDYRLLAAILAGELASSPNPAQRARAAGRRWGARLAGVRDTGEKPGGAGTRRVGEKPGRAGVHRAGEERRGAGEEQGGLSPEQAMARLVGLLDGLGFAPQRTGADGSRIGLRHCPFLELAQADGRVVCPLHLGLMQGALATLGAPITVTRLDPFAEPDLCLAHVGPVPA